jgi:hypothetical protein
MQIERKCSDVDCEGDGGHVGGYEDARVVLCASCLFDSDIPELERFFPPGRYLLEMRTPYLKDSEKVLLPVIIIPNLLDEDMFAGIVCNLPVNGNGNGNVKILSIVTAYTSLFFVRKTGPADLLSEHPHLKGLHVLADALGDSVWQNALDVQGLRSKEPSLVERLMSKRPAADDSFPDEE